MGNLIYKELEDLLDPSLPRRFTLYVPDAWMKGLILAGMYSGEERVALTTTRLTVTMMLHDIVLRADSDPEDFETVH